MEIRFIISLKISGGSSDSNGPMYSGQSWRRIRQQVARRDKHVCQYCGEATRDGEVDHIIPLSGGGTDALDNLAWSCASCNRSKGSKILDEWREADTSRHKVDLDKLIDDDGKMDPDLKGFYDTAAEIGTSIRAWETELGRNRYAVYRDALIGRGFGHWNSYKWDGTPNFQQGWSIGRIDNAPDQLALDIEDWADKREDG